MPNKPLYSVNQYPVSVLLAWATSESIAIPEIQRPFVWTATKVRNLLDSLYQGYPVGYLITWQNPSVQLKDGTTSFGKRILIDGQQRIIALEAALLAKEVVNQDYKKVRIPIAFHPGKEKFEVTNAAISNDAAWIPDIAPYFAGKVNLFKYVNDYCAQNPGAIQEDVFANLQRLTNIVNNQIGVIDLAPDLDIETVTEIFIRVNSAGVALNQADFAMSKIAVNSTLDGNNLRKAIDYFCHLSVQPQVYDIIGEHDTEFVKTKYCNRWPG